MSKRSVSFEVHELDGSSESAMNRRAVHEKIDSNRSTGAASVSSTILFFSLLTVDFTGISICKTKKCYAETTNT